MTSEAHITEEYGRQADELVRLLSDSSSEMVSWRPEASRWSLLEIAGHLADAELIASVRIRRIITQDRPNLYGYDQEVWATRLGYRRQEIEDVALIFVTLRRANANLLDQLAYEDWNLAGYHDEEGATSLYQLIEDCIAQTSKHLNQMRTLMAEFAKQRNGKAQLSPSSSAAEAESVASGAQFYGLALLAGLTIVVVGFFMQSVPILGIGGVISTLSLILLMLVLLRK
jgi:hypothetical protein